MSPHREPPVPVPPVPVPAAPRAGAGAGGRAAPEPEVPVMVDVRLLPPALTAWATTSLVVSGVVSPRLAVALALPTLVVVGALAAWWWLGVRGRPRRAGAHARTPGGSLRLAAALCAAVAAGALACSAAAASAHSRDPLVRAVAGGPARVDITAVLVGDPAPMRQSWAAGTRSVEVAVRLVRDAAGGGAGSAVPSSARLLVQGPGMAHLARGDVVRMEGRVDTTFRSDPPFAGTLHAQAPTLVERPGGWVGAARAVRQGVVAATTGLAPQARALVPGMAVGDDRLMPADLREAMLASSLTHLTAVSGSHVAIMLGVVVRVVPGRGVLRAGAALASMAALVAVVGPEPSVVRSVATAAVGVLGLLTRRPGQAQAALCAVATAILLVDPWSARSLGFALSVLATWGVIGPAARWTRRAHEALRDDTWAGRLAAWAVGVVAVPVAAQLMVAPVLVLLTPWLPTWGVLANLAAGPAVAPASLLGLAAACTAWWWPGGGHALAAGAGVPTGWIAAVGRTMASWPLARLPWPGGVGGSVLLVGVAAAVGLASRWGRLAVAGLGRRWRGLVGHWAPSGERPSPDGHAHEDGGVPWPGRSGRRRAPPSNSPPSS